ncbi:MAG: hypothetical protein AAF497_16535 [Planctomycetota bacterium]
MTSKIISTLLYTACVISLPASLSARNVTVEFDALVTIDFSSGPCIGLNPVDEMVTGYIVYDDSVADSDPSFNEGHFVDSIVSFSFSVGSSMGTVAGPDFNISTLDSDTLGGDNEKLLAILLNPSTVLVPAGPSIELNALFFQLFNSTNSVFADPDSLTGIIGIYDEFDLTGDSRFQVVGQCTAMDQSGDTGIYGFEAEIQRVRFVPEPATLQGVLILTCFVFACRRRFFG